MIRIFISMPLGDRTEAGIEQERRMIEEWCKWRWRDEQIVFVPPLSQAQIHLNDPAHNLGFSIQHMALADKVVFSPDWEKARGCRVEELVAREYGMERVMLAHTEDPSTPYREIGGD